MPMRQFHVCHLPSGSKKFDRIRIKEQKSGIHLVVGYKGNRSEIISIRYPTSKFTKTEARERCAKHKGARFEAAAPGKMKEHLVDPRGFYADYRRRAFPMTGEHVIHSHNAIHKQWRSDSRFGVCEDYEERDFILTHLLITAELRRRGLEHRYSDDLDHTLPLYLKQASSDYEGEVITDYVYDVCGEVVATTTEDAKGIMEQIPTAEGVDLKKLTGGDDKPFFVVIRAMRVGMSRNRRRYSDEIVKKFRDLHPMPGYESHRHVDKPIFGGHPEMFHPVTSWIGALLKGDELFSKGYIRKEEERLIRTIETAHAIGKGLVVSITGKVEQILKKDDEGEFWEIQDIADGTIDWYQPTATPGIPGAGSLTHKKGKSA